jgi:hypothetical protein
MKLARILVIPPAEAGEDLVPHDQIPWLAGQPANRPGSPYTTTLPTTFAGSPAATVPDSPATASANQSIRQPNTRTIRDIDTTAVLKRLLEHNYHLPQPLSPTGGPAEGLGNPLPSSAIIEQVTFCLVLRRSGMEGQRARVRCATRETEMVYHENEATRERPMPEASLDQRMTAIAEAVRELQEMMKARKLAPDWLDRVIGSMKDEPAFDEVLAYGRAIRRADRPAVDQAP